MEFRLESGWFVDPVRMQILAYVNNVRGIEANVDQSTFTLEDVEANAVRCPDPEAAERMYKGALYRCLTGCCRGSAGGHTSPAEAVFSFLPSITRQCLRVNNIAAIDDVRTRGDSCGGEVTCVIRNVPIGLGTPVFSKLEAELAGAMMSLPATKVRNTSA